MRLGILLVTAIIAFLPTAEACSCRAPSWETNYARANSVFRGRIVDVRYVDPKTKWERRVIVRFAVIEAWKGVDGSEVVMHSNLESAACSGFWPHLVEVGKELLVFAYQEPSRYSWASVPGFPRNQDTVLTTSICSRTSEWSASAGEFRKRFPSGRRPTRARR
jgi:hypothetical protein